MDSNLLDEVLVQIRLYLECQEAEALSIVIPSPPDELEKIFRRIEHEEW